MSENDPSPAPGDSGREGDPTSGTDGPPPAERASLLRKLVRAGAYAAGTLVLVLGLGIGILQTSWGAEQIRRIAETQGSALLDTNVSIEQLSGTFVTSLRAEGIRIGEEPSGAARMDTLAVTYSLWPLLQGRIHVRRLALSGPAATLLRDSTGSWTVSGLESLLADTTAAAPDEAASWAVRIDRLRLERGTVTAQFGAPDSTIRIRDLELHTRGLVSDARGFRGQLQTLDTRLIGFDGTRTARIRAAGSADSTALTLEEAVIETEASRIAAKARWPLGEDASAGSDSLRLGLELDPLALPEAGGFWPGAALPDTLRGTLTAAGTGRRLEARTDLQFAHGGRLDLTGSYEEREPNTRTYRIEGEVRELDLGRLTGAESLASRIGLGIDGTLVRRNETLTDGQIELAADGSSWRGRRIERLTARALVEEGRIEWQGRLAYPRQSGSGARLALDGTIETGAEPLAYRVRGTAEQLQLGIWHPALPETALSGAFDLEGRGTDPASAVAHGGLTLAPLVASGYAVDHLDVSADLNGGRLSGDLRAEAGEGVLATAYEVDSLLTTPRFRVRGGRIDRFDLTPVVGDTALGTALNGEFSAEGRLTSAEGPEVGARVRLDSSGVLGYRIDRADLGIELSGDRLRSELRAGSPYARIDGRADLRPYADPIELSSGRIDFSDLDVGPLIADTSWSSRLAGSLRLEGRGTAFEDLVGRAELDLDSSRVNRQPIRGADLELALDRRNAVLTGTLTTPDGGLELAGSAAPASPDLRYEIDRFDFRNVDLGAWSGSSGLETALTGRAAGWSYRVNSEEAEGALTLRLDSSRVNGGHLSTAQLDADLGGGTITWSGEVKGPSGSAVLDGRVTPFEADPTYEVEGTVSNLDALAFAGDTVASSISGGFAASGRGLELGASESEMRLWAGRSHLGDLRLDTLYAEGGLLPDRIRLDTVEVRSNAGRLVGDGTVAYPDSGSHRLNLRAENLRLEPFGPLVGTDQLAGGGSAEARLFGSSSEPRFDLRVDLGNVTYEEFRVASLEARALGARTDSLLVNLRTEWESVSLPNFLIGSVQTETLIGPNSIGFSSNWAIDPERTGSIGGRIDRRAERPLVQLDSLTMKMGSHRWQLLKPARIQYGTAYRIEDFLLHTEREQIAVDGVIDFDGSHDLIVTVDGMQVDPFADLVGYPGIGGRLSSSVVFTGPATSPRLQGELSVDEMTSSGESVGRLETRLDYADYRVDLESRIVHGDGRDLRLTGYFPADLSTGASGPAHSLSDRPVELRIEADTLRVDWIDPFLDPASWQNPDGWIAGDMQIGGTLGNPDLNGAITLGEGAITLPEMGIRPREASLRALLRDSTVVLERATARSGSGRMRAEGTLDLEDLTLGRFDLDIETENFLAASTRDYRLSADSRLHMSGTTTDPVISGSARLTQADFYLTESMTATELEPVELTADDLQTLESRFGIQVTETDTTTYDFYQALQLDTLEVSFTRDVWLRSSSSPKMAIEFTGELTVVKRPNEIEQVFGTIEVVPTRSYVEQFGRRFDISTGTLTFNGAIENPILDLQAEYEVRARRGMATQASITLGLSGPLENLRFDLGSEEGLSTTEIASYLAFGRPPGQTFRGGGGSSAEEMAVDVAVGQLASLVEGLAATELGLDVVDIQFDPDLGTTLTAGSYLTGSIFASLSFPISVAGNSASSTARNRQLTLEYALSDWLLLRLQRQSGILESDLLWEYSY